MAKKRRGDKPKPKLWVPSAREDREKNSPSGESDGTKPTLWKRAEPLPTDTIWRGSADRMPESYTKDRKWNCPSCDVAPEQRHKQWCPRYLYQLNPYNSAAYDDELFLSNYFETQIWFGEGHPQVKSESALELFPRDPGEILLENAGIVKRKRGAFDDLPAGELPF